MTKSPADKVYDEELLIIGSEGAGAFAAIKAHDAGAHPTVVTKGRMAKSGATVTGIADYRVCGDQLTNLGGPKGDSDPPEGLFKRMVRAGGFLNNQKITKLVTDEAGICAKDYADWGLKWKFYGKGPTADLFSTGREMVHFLKMQVVKRNIKVIEDTMITDILTNKGRCVGAVGIDLRTGEFVVFRAKAVILATGGGMRAWPLTTAPDELTGDGYGAAYRVGCELVDMEFPQFMPGTFIQPKALQGVDLPYHSLGLYIDGWLINNKGERIMAKYDPVRMEHSDRGPLAIAMTNEIREGRGFPGGGVFISLAHLSEDRIKQWRDPNYGPNWRYQGFELIDFVDIIKDKGIMVAPSCHFFPGGIKINENMETGIPGLYAAGEVASGTMGGDRISGCAFTEMTTHGKQAGIVAAEYVKKAKVPEIDEEQVKAIRQRVFRPLELNEGISALEIKKKVQKIAGDKLSSVRNDHDLEIAIQEIEELKKDLPRISVANKERKYNVEWVDALQAENLLLVIEMVARASLMRKESRSGLYRRDYPQTDWKNWTKNIVIKQGADGKMQLSTRLPVVTTFEPPKSEEEAEERGLAFYYPK